MKILNFKNFMKKDNLKKILRMNVNCKDVIIMRYLQETRKYILIKDLLT